MDFEKEWRDEVEFDVLESETERVGKGEKFALALYSSWVLSFEWKMLEDVLRSCSCNFDSAEVLHLAGLL